MTSQAELMQFILAEGLDDWVAICVPAEQAGRLGERDHRAQLEQALGAAVRLAESGLVRFGSLSAKRWEYLDCAPRQVASETMEAYDRSGPSHADFYFWMENTPEGDARARLQAEPSESGATDHR